MYLLFSHCSDNLRGFIIAHSGGHGPSGWELHVERESMVHHGGEGREREGMVHWFTTVGKAGRESVWSTTVVKAWRWELEGLYHS